MYLKRKRSESEFSISSSSCASSVFSSPPRPTDHTAMTFDLTSPSPSRPLSSRSTTTSSHLPSRTMKRFRDSRPSDAEVHRKTLDMLFSAAQEARPQQQPPVFSHPSLPTQQHHAAQTSLHTFWNLPSSPNPSSLPPSTSAPPIDTPITCEDCGQGLRGGAADDAMDIDTSVDVDVDDSSSSAAASCGACGKHVCSHCSITNLGEQRQCLICAGRKVWVGGLGWTTNGLGLGVC
ncbi:hypothetical protein BJ170DRAFT_413577 [Xylariales sp. AK1849]|nr:hypothetical protein BJ170DRAFT_413577 [Xylariales sp. AK1849]